MNVIDRWTELEQSANIQHSTSHLINSLQSQVNSLQYKMQLFQENRELEKKLASAHKAIVKTNASASDIPSVPNCCYDEVKSILALFKYSNDPRKERDMVVIKRRQVPFNRTQYMTT